MNDAAVQLLSRSIGDEGLLSETPSIRDVMTTEPTCVAPGDSVKGRIRDKALSASVVKLPFVRNGKALVS